MASKTTPSPSRIPVPVPVPVRSPPAPTPISACYAVREVSDNANVVSKHHDSKLHPAAENGMVTDTPMTAVVSPQGGMGKGFETFLMTGDMIIRTTPPHQKSRGAEGDSPSPSLKRKDVSGGDSNSPREMFSVETSPKITAPKRIVQTATTENGAQLVAPLPVRAPVASFEELSDMSQSSSSGEFTETPKQSSSNSRSPETPTLVADTSRLDEALETLGRLGSSLPSSQANSADNTLNEAPSSGDSGVLQDSNGSDSDTLDHKDDDVQRVMTTSMSEEKIVSEMSKTDTNRPLVRTSKSHENYLQTEAGLSLVTIDIDDNMAYSLDTLTYQDSNSDSSTEKVSELSQQQVRSLHNSPERKLGKSAGTGGEGDREFLPGFISLQDSRPGKPKLKHHEEGRLNGNSPSPRGDSLSPSADRKNTNTSCDSDGDVMHMSIRSDESDTDSLYHQPSKGVDQPSAARLAKRLYNLEGFRKSDVSRHLSKKNDFSTLVADEYLKYFDFGGDSLDAALRKFLHQFCLTGETQERERVLAHFSRHFIECNPGAFNSEGTFHTVHASDACHTLTCAIMLLNTDLHGQNIGRKMTCADFVENLSDLNDGENFPKEVLKSIYNSIKAEPIEWAVDDSVGEGDGQTEEGVGGSAQPSTTMIQLGGGNPFLDVPDPTKTVEYKKGYVMRKSCMEPGKRKTPFGKRGWRMVYVVLRDLILYQYKDEHQVKKGQFVESANNVIRVHHALATKASDYTKKQHVLRLQTSDWSEFLFQTGGTTELQEWIDMINLVAASLSSPPLPSGVGSQSRFQRPLMPSSCTKLNIHEQLGYHSRHIGELEQELQLHRAAAPEKGSKSTTISTYLEKESYLEFELKRFKTYVYLLQAKVMSPMELEPSLVETSIGEDEEMTSLQGSPVAAGHGAFVGPAAVTSAKASSSRPVQRSLSDSPCLNMKAWGTFGNIESLDRWNKSPLVRKQKTPTSDMTSRH
ncbi:PH and SEC7 domain-containing protein 1-like isoform X2 [Littorina saxatilis]|uniref:PH and SEC7 domain-containing protein 1-like isoform X2 n=1 Tax=Littorina saxatilis TaxID=31220 RepID=UPI0038B6430C